MSDLAATGAVAAAGPGKPDGDAPVARGGLGFILLVLLLDAMGFGLIIPVVPELVVSLTGLSLSAAASVGGWLVMSYALAQFLFSPLLGNLSDRFGRRPVLLASMAGFGVNMLISGLSTQLWMLFLGRTIAGIFGASASTATAAIADTTPPHKRAERFGLVGVAFGLGFIFGPAIGGVVGDWHPRAPFFVAAGLAGLNFLVGLVLLKETLRPERRRAFDWRRANPLGSLRQLQRLGGRSAALGLSIFLWQFSLQALQSIWPYYSGYRYGWTPLMIGLSLTFVGVLAVLVNWQLVKRSVRNMGEWKTAMLGVAGGAGSFLVYAAAENPRLVFVGMTLGALGGLVMPAIQAMLTSGAPADEQGELQGGVAALMSFAVIIGPPVMSHIFSRFTGPEASPHLPGAPFFLAVALSATALLVLYRAGPGNPADHRP
jgi:DHA1 family tetracycline resistance protein-like MFS transporter